MPAIELFFDHTCPYCYRGHAALMQLLPDFPAAEILWLPVEAHPRLEEPWHKPYEDLAVQAALFVRSQGGDELAYHERVYRAVFEEHRAVDDIGVLVALCAELGLPKDALQHALREGTFAKEQLAANAYAYGQKKVWAVPTLVCGQRRLDAVENVGITQAQLKAFLEDCCR